MIRNLSIMVLMDNTSNISKPQLFSEHGLALWIEADGRRILFDTGQSDKCIHNAEMLGIDLCRADTLILSHGHYDHTGAVAEILKRNPAISIYCHAGVFTPRYSRQSDGTMKPIGIPKDASNALLGVIDKIHWITWPVNLSDSIGITGAIPRVTTFEDTGGAFFLNTESKKQDMIIDDLAMWFNTEDGVVIVTGCCHSGIINTIEHTFFASGSKTLRAIIGGLHLVNAVDRRLEETCLRLNSLSPERIIACHCTGDTATQYLVKNLPSIITKGSVGMKIDFH
jgi:7,8-dihydropterin-6-yl-methyl-4-(beta-D-ribofuranosyl)aminobenzene 5'-phosphate synthase